MLKLLENILTMLCAKNCGIWQLSQILRQFKIDESVLTLLDKRGSGVTAEIYTHSPNAHLQLDIQRHDSQYTPIPIHVFTRSHDRFLCIDDTVYHIGASLKDLGKKWFAFSRMEINTESLLEKM